MFSVVVLMGFGATAQAGLQMPVLGDPDHFMGYQAQETDKKGDALPKECHVKIGDPCFAEEENLTVSKTKAIFLPADKNGEGVVDPNSHLIAYQVKPAKQGAAQPVGKCSKASSKSGEACTDDFFCPGGECEKMKYLKGSKHTKRESKTSSQVSVVNQFGAITLDTNKRDLLLVPAAKDLSGPPSPLSGSLLDHYLCYKAKESKVPIAVAGIPSQQDSKGKLRKNLQVSSLDQFEDGGAATPIIYDIKKVTHLCNPVTKFNIDSTTGKDIRLDPNVPLTGRQILGQRQTDCLVDEAPHINSGAPLVCYQAKIASKRFGVCSDDPNQICKADKDCGGTCDTIATPDVPGYPFPSVSAGVKVDPKPKHVSRVGKNGTQIFVDHQFPNPDELDTKKELAFCVPSQKCGDGVVNLPGEVCDDGNMTDGDGCSSTCQTEFCGDGVVQAGIGEFCDPPGSSCSGGGTCGSTCLCPVEIGRQVCELDARQFAAGHILANCAGGANDGKTCFAPSDCPGGLCLEASRTEVNAQLGATIFTPLLRLPIAGHASMTCGTIDPNTGVAPCTCELDDVLGIFIGSVGAICITGDPNAPCPPGEIDCDGGDPLDVDLEFNHNITTCGLGDERAEDPNDENLLICVDNFDNEVPCDGQDECATACATYCDHPALGNGPDYEVLNSGCEGYCQEGPRDGFPCENDIECPDGGCVGGEPATEHENFCNCTCKKIVGGPSRPGAMQCNVRAGLVTEFALPCDGLDVDVTTVKVCFPLTTETSTGILKTLNIDPNAQIGPLVNTGTTISCADMAAGRMDDLSLVGEINFGDVTTLSDTAAEFITNCR